MSDRDLSFDIKDYRLNIRSTGVMIHNGKLLIHKDTNFDHYALVGGRVEIGEDSVSTLKREIKEEMGKEIEVTGYIATIENFFESEGKKFHEIMFIHKIEFIDEEDKKIESTIKNIEGHDYLTYEWIDMDRLDEYPLLPEALKDIFKENDYPTYRINIDSKTS